ncbi:MAG: hypothetical protein ACE5JZ_12510, partial [Kiloniellales bacterium]
MRRVHVLSEGFVSPNGRAFLFPIVTNSRLLRELGLEVRIFTAPARELTDCDVLMVDSKVHRARWAGESQAVLDEFHGYAEKVRGLVYCDTTDSAGWLEARLLPIVRLYCKSMLLADRAGYGKPLYGHRIFADYYHRTAGVEDAHPEYSTPVAEPAQLAKLRVSWNSGLADYSLIGPSLMALYRWLPLKALLSPPRRFTAPSAPRSLDVSCRFAITYSRASVGWQRAEIRRRLGDLMPTEKLRRPAYFAELRRARIVISPFGWGEITLKDFEVFLTGGMLLKPDMGHVETWPDLFRAGETMAVHRWDLDDLRQVLDTHLA